MKNAGPGRSRRPKVDGLGDDVGAAELARRVGDSLKKLRKERALSLDQLAVASGVSRAALSQIEMCRSNPSLAVLWKVAVGLKVPFQALLGPIDRAARLLRAGDATPLRTADGRIESLLLSPPAGASRIEVYELRFKSKGILRSESHGNGAFETVILLTGALRITVGPDPYDLVAGDTLYFDANADHSYENVTLRESRCIDIIGYGAA